VDQYWEFYGNFSKNFAVSCEPFENQVTLSTDSPQKYLQGFSNFFFVYQENIILAFLLSIQTGSEFMKC
jgi:hypothetical protein